jgi:hypothetical protein
MSLASPTALLDFGALVFCDDSLYLHKQLILGTVAHGAIEKHDLNTIPFEFV